MVDYLAANKRSVCLDYDLAEGSQLADSLCRAADVILYDNTSPYFDRYLLDKRVYQSPPVVLTVLTPYGLHSPYQILHDDELLIFALSGASAKSRPPLAGE